LPPKCGLTTSNSSNCFWRQIDDFGPQSAEVEKRERPSLLFIVWLSS
jgi:hypothetical protein